MTHLASPHCLLSLALDAGNDSFTDHVAARPNLNRACRRIVANGGAPGVDGMTVQQLATAWPQLRPVLASQLLDGAYAPAPIRRHAVPKPAGGSRVLGIPTVLDRVAQLALVQPLGMLVDDSFSPFSFGFRSGRNAHGALLQAASQIQAGRPWVLHLDLEKFFDSAPHRQVLDRLSERVADTRVTALAARFLAAPFADGGRRLESRSQGLPQGGPLSPLLANLLLDPLDRRLHDAGFAFCRYADDICLYLETEADAHEAVEMITPWIETDLQLRLNRDKTYLGPAEGDVFLGHRLARCGGRIGFAPSAVAGQRLRRAVRRLLARHRTGNPREVISRAVVPLLQGWAAYFCLTGDQRVFSALDHWAVRELRRWLWRRALHPQRRMRLLIRRGVRPPVARALAAAWTPDTPAAEAACAQAFSLPWLQARGWMSCTATPVSPVRFQAESSPKREIEASLRSATRDCDLYERLGRVLSA
jgi:RNA-directed DNA polymerase